MGNHCSKHGWYQAYEGCLHCRDEGAKSQLAAALKQLEEAERLISGLLKMAADAMKAWEFAATHGIGLVDEKTAKEKEELKNGARAFLNPTPPSEMCIRCGKEKATHCTPEGICDKCWEAEGFGKNTPPATTPGKATDSNPLLSLGKHPT